MSRAARGSLLLLAYVGFISLGLPDGLLGVAWPSMWRDFGVDVGAVGLLLTVGVVGYLSSSVVTGFALARVGVGWLLAGSTALAALALYGYSIAPFFLLVPVFSLLLGLGSGAIDAGLNVYAASHFGPRHMNWLHASWGFGATMGPLVMTAVLGSGLAWRWGYGLTAAAQTVLAIAFAFTARAWQDGPVAAPAEAASVAPVPRRRGAALRVTAVWLGAFTFAAYTGIEFSAGLWAFTLLTEGRGLSPTVAGTCVSVYWGSLFVGRVLYGVVATRLSSRVTLLTCMTGMGVGAAVLALPAPGWVAVTGLMMIGGSAAPVFPLLTLTTADRVGPANAGPAVGIQIAAAGLGGVAFPAGIGLLFDRYGTDVLAWVLIAMSAALIGAYLLTLRVAHGHGNVVPARQD
jgi:fucose permease